VNQSRPKVKKSARSHRADAKAVKYFEARPTRPASTAGAASRAVTTRSGCWRSSVCARSTTSVSARWPVPYDRARKVDGKTARP